jgi:hypothetical protein
LAASPVSAFKPAAHRCLLQPHWSETANEDVDNFSKLNLLARIVRPYLAMQVAKILFIGLFKNDILTLLFVLLEASFILIEAFSSLIPINDFFACIDGSVLLQIICDRTGLKQTR